jgi:hypothetical protein
MERLMSSAQLDCVAFHDSDLPWMKWTAVAFRPTDRESGQTLFGHLPLA